MPNYNLHVSLDGVVWVRQESSYDTLYEATSAALDYDEHFLFLEPIQDAGLATGAEAETILSSAQVVPLGEQRPFDSPLRRWFVGGPFLWLAQTF